MLRKRQKFAGVHILEPLVGCLRRFHQLRIRPVGYIDKSNVVILAIHAAKHCLVTPREPIRADKPLKRCRLLHVIAIGVDCLRSLLREMPNIQKFAEEYKDDLIVWGVSFDQPDLDKKWLAQHQQQFPSLSDTEYGVSDLYKVHGIPALVLIDATGIVRGYWEGTVPMADLEAALKRALRRK